MCVSSGRLWNRASTWGMAGFTCCDVTGKNLCLSRTVACGTGCRLGCCCFGAWRRMYASAATEQKSNRDICEVRNLPSLLGTRSRFQGVALTLVNHPYRKTISVTLVGAGEAHLHLRTHTHTYDRPCPMLTVWISGLPPKITMLRMWNS